MEALRTRIALSLKTETSEKSHRQSIAVMQILAATLRSHQIEEQLSHNAGALIVGIGFWVIL